MCDSVYINIYIYTAIRFFCIYVYILNIYIYIYIMWVHFEQWSFDIIWIAISAVPQYAVGLIPCWSADSAAQLRPFSTSLTQLHHATLSIFFGCCKLLQLWNPPLMWGDHLSNSASSSEWITEFLLRCLSLSKQPLKRRFLNGSTPDMRFNTGFPWVSKDMCLSSISIPNYISMT